MLFRWYVAGTVAGTAIAAGVGAFLAYQAGYWLSSQSLRVWTAMACLGLLFIVFLADMYLHTRLLPQNRRQIPQSALEIDRRLAVAQFGFEMATGVRTFAYSPLPQMGLIFALAMGSSLHGGLLGLGFAVGRLIFARLFQLGLVANAERNGQCEVLTSLAGGLLLAVGLVF